MRPSTRTWLALAALLLLAGLWVSGQYRRDARVGADATASTPATDTTAHLPSPSSDTARWPAFLPAQALDTLRLIERGGPFPHRQDGGVFGNRERLLPARPRGYYHEYTVDTPGSRDRGARRIISGGDPPSEFFYTDDHYRSFRRFTPGEAGPR